MKNHSNLTNFGQKPPKMGQKCFCEIIQKCAKIYQNLTEIGLKNELKFSSIVKNDQKLGQNLIKNSSNKLHKIGNWKKLDEKRVGKSPKIGQNSVD